MHEPLADPIFHVGFELLPQEPLQKRFLGSPWKGGKWVRVEGAESVVVCGCCAEKIRDVSEEKCG
jgi:hypothetical protein